MNKQQLEEIINNAPEIEGVVFDGRYFKYADGIWLVYTGGCPDYEECAFHDSPKPVASRVRKLSDLQTQLNLLNEIERLKSKIDELEKESKRLQEDEFQCGIIEAENNILKEENAELKDLQQKYVWVTREEMKEYSDIHQALMGQSLAQHDKEVAVKAIMDFRQYLDEQGFKSVQKAVINKYAEQLQEQS